MRATLDRSATIVAEEFGSSAIYSPIVGDPVELLAVMTYQAELLGPGEGIERRDIADVRMDDIATPVQGDVLNVDGDVYEVDRFDRSGSLWRLILIRQ